jgi:hypothetical protein
VQLEPIRRLAPCSVQEIEKPDARYGQETVEWGSQGRGANGIERVLQRASERTRCCRHFDDERGLRVDVLQNEVDILVSLNHASEQSAVYSIRREFVRREPMVRRIGDFGDRDGRELRNGCLNRFPRDLGTIKIGQCLDRPPITAAARCSNNRLGRQDQSRDER